MPDYTRHGAATSNVLAWTAHAANAVEEDAASEADEPPDQARQATATTQQDLSSISIHSFQKTVVYRPREHTESLLTRALQSQSEDETAEHATASGLYPRRRRSITSNASLASTAGFTSDTGITTPARTSSPSPRLANLGLTPVPLHVRVIDDTTILDVRGEVDTAPKFVHDSNKLQKLHTTEVSTAPTQTEAQAPQRKRCISFACGPVKPSQNSSKSASPSTSTRNPGPDDTPKAVYAELAKPDEVAQIPETGLPAQPKRSCIRFACPVRPSTDAHKPHLSAVKVNEQEARKLPARKPSPAPEPKSPSSTRKHLRGGSSARSPRSATRASSSRQSSHSPVATRAKKYYNAAPGELNGESSRFHGFASDAPLEDDWIIQDKATFKQRLTIDDTLQKELAIRRLGKEAEEEAEQEDDEEDNDGEDNDIVDDDGDDDEDGDDNDNDTVEGENDDAVDDLWAGYSSGEDGSDGYNTDNETGFASSDEEEDDDLILWTVNRSRHQRREDNFDTDHTTLHQGGTPVFRRLSVDEHSDSSGFVAGRAMRQEIPKNRELASSIHRPATPELPDSTDFVCGTFDEDRPLEEAYQTHIAARKRGKLHVIPQDIDPSFPTSDPEDNSDNEAANQKKHRAQQQHGSADDRIWEMEDIHQDRHDREDARRKKKAESPRRYRSPPPPKNRGRSPAPRRLFDRLSPGRRLKSPAPRAVPVPTVPLVQAHLVSPPASPVDELNGRGRPVFQALASKPGLTRTKSLPRTSAIFRHQQQSQAPACQTQPRQTRRPKANSLAGATRQPKHVRGAIDIVKGLEQKRQRRKEKFQQKYCNRARKGHVLERRPQRGEGAERMREVGLLMAGKIPQGNYVLSI